MYELIDATEYPQHEERPLIIAKYEEKFGMRRMVFSLRLHDKAQALEILAKLNGEGQE